MKIQKYLRLGESGELPDVSRLRPFKVVVIIEMIVTPARQREISAWLARSGCRFMMAWGSGCSSWDDSVDMANMERFNLGHIPDEEFIMTTWHENEPLEDVFHFSRTAAITYDQSEELPNVLLLHLGTEDKGKEFGTKYEDAASIS